MIIENLSKARYSQINILMGLDVSPQSLREFNVVWEEFIKVIASFAYMERDLINDELLRALRSGNNDLVETSLYLVSLGFLSQDCLGYIGKDILKMSLYGSDREINWASKIVAEFLVDCRNFENWVTELYRDFFQTRNTSEEDFYYEYVQLGRLVGLLHDESLKADYVKRGQNSGNSDVAEWAFGFE